MPHQRLFADRITRDVGGVVAAAGLVGRLGHLQRAVEQGLDRAAGGFAGGAGLGRRVVGSQQAGLHRGLAQQLGAGALAQLVGGQLLAGLHQGHAVDAGDEVEGGGHGGRHGGGHRKQPVQDWRCGWFCPAGTFRRRERTTWYGRNR